MKYQLHLKRLLLLAACAASFLAACSSGDGDGDKLRVVATTTQIGDFARRVGGDRIALTVLLQPNQDAHDFEPQPSQVRAINQAALVLRNGLGLDTFVNRALGGSGGEVVVVTEGARLRGAAEEEADDQEAAAEADGADPHVWFSVPNARRMVANIRDAMAAADPQNAQYYADNARAYDAELEQLDSEVRTSVESIPQACRKLVTNHDVLGYFADEYGLRFVGSVIPGTSTEARASAADVADIAQRIRQESVPAIFAETGANAALVRQVAREAGVTVVGDLYGDSLGPEGSPAATYVGMMRWNTERIVSALRNCRA